MTRVLIVVMFMGAAFKCPGDQAVFTRSECVRMSLERSAAARTAVLNEAVAGAKVRQARSIALPHIGVSASYTRLDEVQEIEFGDESVPMGSIDNYSIDASVNQLLFAGGKVGAALNAARLTRGYAVNERRESESFIAKQAVQLFNNILLAEQTLSVIDETVGLLAKMADRAQSMYAQGQISEYDLLSARVRHRNELPEQIRARNSLAVLKENMRNLAGIDGEFSLAGSVALDPVEADAERLYLNALEARSSLQCARIFAELSREDAVSVRSDLMPSLSAFFTYNGANSYRFVSFGDDAIEWHWNAGLVLSWNIWDGDLTRGLLKEKNLAHDIALVKLDDMQRSLKLEIKTAVLELEHAAEAVASSEQNIELAVKAMDIASARYEAGLATYLDYTDAAVALKRARLAYLSSVCAHENAKAELKYASGDGPQSIDGLKRGELPNE